MPSARRQQPRPWRTGPRRCDRRSEVPDRCEPGAAMPQPIDGAGPARPRPTAAATRRLRRACRRRAAPLRLRCTAAPSAGPRHRALLLDDEHVVAARARIARRPPAPAARSCRPCRRGSRLARQSSSSMPRSLPAPAARRDSDLPAVTMPTRACGAVEHDPVDARWRARRPAPPAAARAGAPPGQRQESRQRIVQRRRPASRSSSGTANSAQRPHVDRRRRSPPFRRWS